MGILPNWPIRNYGVPMRFGFPPIDQDHEQILLLAAEVERLILASAPAGEIRTKFHEMTEISLEHFIREETHMERCGYPGTAAHRREHAELGDWLVHIETALVEEGPSASAAAQQDVLAFFRAWIQRHLEMLDQPAVRYIASHSGSLEARRTG